MTEPIKCVVWDLDGTLWPEVAVELPPGRRPQVLPQARRALAALAQRGILNSVASRTDPSTSRFLEQDPELSGWFVAAQLGWGHKSDAIARIAAELGIDPADMALVDDDPFERAEVAAMLPQVLVLTPAELHARLETARFRPATVTDDARHRLARYRQEQRRRDAEAGFAGDRKAFLRGCRLRLAVGQAVPADLDRLAELVARTHRFNSTGERWTRRDLCRLVDDPGWSVPVARLTDRFGDYGLIAAALLERDPTRPRLHLFTVSCRAVGRDVPAAFLSWVLARTRAAGAEQLRMDVRAHRANLELRVLLRRSGFRAGDREGLLTRPLADDPPAAPPWLKVIDG